ncbi:MAG: hypothetical protein IT384_13525 [Deltaproteobacteria bacterium]|nr:hypothetical protein [Deltaproteobacteria bacterium]
MSFRVKRGVATLAVAFGAGAFALGAWPRAAEARGVEDCMLWWAQAVRSYLTQNRTQGPEDEIFRPACEIEGKGDKAKARIEAVLLGARSLSKLDPRGCERFLEVYVQSKEPQKICAEAAGEAGDAALRKLIASTIPDKPVKK